jgi:hypothetical protein
MAYCSYSGCEPCSGACCLLLLLPCFCPPMGSTGLPVPVLARLPPGVMTLPCASCHWVPRPEPLLWGDALPQGGPAARSGLPAPPFLPRKPSLKLMPASPGRLEPTRENEMLIAHGQVSSVYATYP